MTTQDNTSTTTPFEQARSKADLEHGGTFAPRFDASGLIPAIVTDANDGQVLMFAWMNAETLALTLETGIAHFWSRSRGRVWNKGEESGNTLAVSRMLTDCDQDVVWMSVTVAGKGRACHTGARSCFYREIVMPAEAGGPYRLVPAADASETPA
ncbi:MAG: phosphoribosyl-AMP cyclohydrolase [Hyphomicrobiaceae bacterium]|nr:phosphoribosyl-AMP cyclohydrolase [Hyphomicrobiaceae bacterium]